MIASKLHTHVPVCVGRLVRRVCILISEYGVILAGNRYQEWVVRCVSRRSRRSVDHIQAGSHHRQTCAAKKPTGFNKLGKNDKFMRPQSRIHGAPTATQAHHSKTAVFIVGTSNPKEYKPLYVKAH